MLHKHIAGGTAPRNGANLASIIILEWKGLTTLQVNNSVGGGGQNQAIFFTFGVLATMSPSSYLHCSS